MKIKKEYIMLAVITVSLSLYLVFHKSDNVQYKLPILEKIQQQNINKVHISKKNIKMILTQEDDKWFIEPKKYPVDPSKIKQILDVIDDLTLTTLVSESQNYERYKLDENNRIHVRAYKGDDLKREFSIGKDASPSKLTFIKLKNDPKVYHARENFRDIFNQTTENYRDKNILAFETKDVQEVKIDSDKNSMLISQKKIPIEAESGKDTGEPIAKTSKTGNISTADGFEVVWETASGKRAVESKVNSLLFSLSKLSCKNYIEGRNKNDFVNPIFTVKIKGTQEYTLSIFDAIKKDDEEHPAISSENDYPFILPKWQVDKILKESGEMLEKDEKE